jgi:DNA-binding IclR family transcriptional regulator
MGLTALHQLEPTREAMPIVESLAADTEQAVAVSVWGNLGSTVIRMIDARQPLHVAMRPGTVMSTFGTATGRAFAAVLPVDKIRASLIPGALGSLENGIQASDSLDELMGSARDEFGRHGCTRALGRPIPGVNAFSVPVFDHEGDPVLVVTLLGHQDYVPGAWTSSMKEAVVKAASEISNRLGFSASRSRGY